MVSVHSRAEHDFLNEIAGNSRFNGYNGLSRSCPCEDGPNCPWRWSDGSEFDYENWQPGEPNNCATVWQCNAPENCADIVKFGSGGWNSYPCRSLKQGFVCKKYDKEAERLRLITPMC